MKETLKLSQVSSGPPIELCILATRIVELRCATQNVGYQSKLANEHIPPPHATEMQTAYECIIQGVETLAALCGAEMHKHLRGAALDGKDQ